MAKVKPVKNQKQKKKSKSSALERISNKHGYLQDEVDDLKSMYP